MSEDNKPLDNIAALTAGAAAPAAPKTKVRNAAPTPEQVAAMEAAPDPVKAIVDSVKEPGSVKSLPENRLRLVLSSAADVGNGFAAVTPAGTPFDHVLEPEFWAHTAYKLHACDEITIHTDDGSYYGRLYVRSVSAPGAQRLNNRAVVAELERHIFDALSANPAPSDYEVKWMGPHMKWCVVSLKDQRVIKEGCGTQEEARLIMMSRLAA